MRAIQRQSFIDRIRGVITLDQATYEEIGSDQQATVPAAGIVLVAALAFGLLFPDGGVAIALVLACLALLTWLLFSAIAYVVGTRYLAKSPAFASWESVLRGVGFASIPLLASAVILLPGIAFVAFLGVVTWTAVAIVAAIRYVLNLSIGGAIIAAIVAAFGIWALRTMVGFILILLVNLG